MMTLAELIEHTENLQDLLRLKRHQLAHLKVDSTARARHEVAINALEGRVRELRRSAELLRGETPTLEFQRALPQRPPLSDVIGEPETISDLPAPASKIGA